MGFESRVLDCPLAASEHAAGQQDPQPHKQYCFF